MGLATAKDGNIRVSVHTLTILERREIDRVGQQMAKDRGLTFVPSSTGEHVSGRLAGVTSLVSGRFAMIESGLGFQLVPWQPSLSSASASTSLVCGATTEASNGPLEGTGGSASSIATANSEPFLIVRLQAGVRLRVTGCFPSWVSATGTAALPQIAADFL